MNNPINPVVDSLKAGYKGFGAGGPAAVAAALAAGLIAPAVLSNDDRGYARTSLLTTPVIGAGFAAAADTWSGLRQAGSGLKAFAQNQPYVLNDGKLKRSSLIDLRNKMERFGSDPETLAQLSAELQKAQYSAGLDYFGGIAKLDQLSVASMREQAISGLEGNKILNKIQSLDPEVDADKILELQAKLANYQENMTYALHEAKMKSATLSDFNAGGDPFKQLPTSTLSMAEIQAGVEKGWGESEDQGRKFYQTILSRDRGAIWLNSGTTVTPAMESITHAPPVSMPFANPEVQKLLVAQSKQLLYDAMQNAVKNNWVNQATLLVQDGQAVGINVVRGEGGKSRGLTWGLVDKDKGTIRWGSDLEHVGAARHVFVPDGKGGLEKRLLDEHMALSLNPEYLNKDFRKSVKQLRNELARFAIYTGRNHDDSYMAALLKGGASDTSLLPAYVIQRRAAEYGASTLGYWGGKNLDDLSYEEKIGIIRKMEAAGLTKTSSESSLKNLIFQDKAEEMRIFGQLPTRKETNWVTRSETKNLHFKQGSLGSLEGSFAETEAVWKDHLERPPTARMTIAGVTPQQKTFFGDLPEDAARMFDADVRAKGVNALIEDMLASGMTNKQLMNERANHAYDVFADRFLAHPGELDSVRKFGALGESDVLLSSAYGRASQTENGVSFVKLLKVNKGQQFVSDQVIGYDEVGRPVTSPAPDNVVSSIQWNETQQGYNVYHERTYPFETGSKIDAGGLKTLVIVDHEGELATQSDLLNSLYEMTGRGRPIADDITGFGDSMYFNAKVAKKDPVQALMSNAGDLIDNLKLPNAGGSPPLFVEEALEKLKTLGVYRHPETGTLLEQSAIVAKLSDPQKAKRLEELQQVVEDMFHYAEYHIALADSSAELNPLFSGYLAAKRSGAANRGLLDYSQFFHQAVHAWSWDNTRRDIPKQVSVTFDFLGSLYRSGEHETLSEIVQASTSVHGDVAQAYEFAEHFRSREFDKPLGEVTSLEKLKGFDPRNPESLRGSIFDPSSERFSKNHSIDMGESKTWVIGDKQYSGRYIPVRGNAGYKAAGNPYSAGEMAVTDYQQSLVDLIKAAEGGDADLFAKRSGDYATEIYGDLLGKGGMLRPDLVYPNAVAGAIQTRSTGDAFTTYISEDMLKGLSDETVTKLRAGDEVFATMHRHPISATPYFSVKLANKENKQFLGHNMIGIDESVRSLIQADDDKDVAYLMFLESDKAIDRARQATAVTSDVTKMSNQRRLQRGMELLQGNSDNSRAITGKFWADKMAERGKSGFGIVDQLHEVIAEANGNRFANVEARLAHSTTGQYSNLVTKIHMNLENHPTLRNSADRALAEQSFWLIRQVPISAGKGKGNLGDDPGQLYRQISAALQTHDPDAAVASGQQAMLKIAEGMGFKTTMNSAQDITDAESLFGVKKYLKDGQLVDLSIGSEVNLHAESIRGGKMKAITDEFFRHRSHKTDDFVKILTSNDLTVEQYERGMAGIGFGSSAILDAGLGKKSSNVVSEALGGANRALANAMGKMGAGLQKAVPVLAAGLGIAAVAGMLSMPIGSGSRPEERSGETDRVPGEPGEGSMSNRPRVNIVPSQPRTQTAIVAPMRKSTDIEVRASAPSREASAETARLIEQMQNRGGTSNVTVNHVGGWHNSASKLRIREKLREDMERDNRY